MAPTSEQNDKPTTSTNASPPEQKSSSWVLLVYLAIPVLFLIGVMLFKSN